MAHQDEQLVSYTPARAFPEPAGIEIDRSELTSAEPNGSPTADLTVVIVFPF